MKSITTFNKSEYIQSGIWFNNPFLINPNTISKKCSCCQKIKFTIEFADYDDEFADGKLPVCVSCLRSRSEKRRKKMINILDNGMVKTCKKCLQAKQLYHFPYNIKTFGLNASCRECKNKKDGREKRKGTEQFR